MTNIILPRQNIAVAGHTIKNLKNAQQERVVLKQAANEI